MEKSQANKMENNFKELQVFHHFIDGCGSGSAAGRVSW